MSEDPRESRGITRRQALVAGAGGLGALALGGYGLARALDGDSPSAPEPPADLVVRAAPTTVNLGPRSVETWTYGETLPGPGVRIRQGVPVRIRVENGLPEETAVHWHGIRLANAADGVPGLTQDAIAPGDSFTYAFTPPDAGTYFFHSHAGLQLDRGLYAPLVVEPTSEPMSYDRDEVLLLDDWLDGVGGTPDDRFASLQKNGMPMGGMDMGSGMDMGIRGMGSGAGGSAGGGRHTDLNGGAPAPGTLPALANLMENGRADAGDVPDYPFYLINGRPPEDPYRVVVRQRDRVRLRLVNAGADTAFCFFVEGHVLTVTHSDGSPVKPVETDALLIGMGERYDVVIEARSEGARRMIAVPLGKKGRAVAVLRTGPTTGRVAAPDAPFTMPPRIVSYTDLRSADTPPRTASAARETRLTLDMKMGSGYVWTIGGRPFDDAPAIEAARGEPQRYVMANRTMMPHPMHLHGHSFRPTAGGPLKDTIMVPPMREVAIDWLPDNPGSWAFHCHNAYHAAAGMMRRVEVL